MAILETAGGGSWDKDRRAPRRGGALAVLLFVVKGGVLCLGTVVLALCGGFLVFLHHLDRADAPQVHRADGIVALTGGAERISDAVDWLRHGNGARLLISGVARDVTRERLAQKAPAVREWLGCCIDLGHAAQTTVGNAKETRHWAGANGYRSLLVVTSSYHMPRAMVELRRHLPDVELHPAPVVTEKLKGLDFWRHPDLLRTIGMEYAKFLVAYARASLTSTRPPGEISAASNRRPV
jgi:uncharacterized SAM-binding protein YcdF (DUF218 family)